MSIIDMISSTLSFSSTSGIDFASSELAIPAVGTSKEALLFVENCL
jgi:hypothetical protein